MFIKTSQYPYLKEEMCLFPTATSKTGHTIEWRAVENTLQTDGERVYTRSWCHKTVHTVSIIFHVEYGMKVFFSQSDNYRMWIIVYFANCEKNKVFSSSWWRWKAFVQTILLVWHWTIKVKQWEGNTRRWKRHYIFQQSPYIIEGAKSQWKTAVETWQNHKKLICDRQRRAFESKFCTKWSVNTTAGINDSE